MIQFVKFPTKPSESQNCPPVIMPSICTAQIKWMHVLDTGNNFSFHRVSLKIMI